MEDKGIQTDWKESYDQLKEAFDAYRAEVEEREALRGVKEAYRRLLEEERVDPRRVELIMRVTDFDGMRLGEDGHLEGEEALREAIRAEWGDFIVTRETRGAVVKRPPVSGKPVRTREEIMAIQDTVERQRAIAENHELFGF